MPDILATVTLPYTSGLPEDVAINTFAFANSSSTDPLEADLTDLIVDFYTSTYAGDALGDFISPVVDRTTNACVVTLAEIVDAGPTVDIGPVYYSDTFTLGAPESGTPLSMPLEVAVVNSFRNVTGSGSVARRRGRIYIGPLEADASLVLDGAYPVVSSELLLTLAGASEALAIASTAADYPWCVWSRVNGTLQPVEAGFINNEFDTQRRRGAEATNRENWSTLV